MNTFVGWAPVEQRRTWSGIVTMVYLMVATHTHRLRYMTISIHCPHSHHSFHSSWSWFSLVQFVLTHVYVLQYQSLLFPHIHMCTGHNHLLALISGTMYVCDHSGVFVCVLKPEIERACCVWIEGIFVAMVRSFVCLCGERETRSSTAATSFTTQTQHTYCTH